MYVNLDYQEFELGDGATIEVRPLDSDAYQKLLTFMTQSSVTEDMSHEDMSTATKNLTNPDFINLIAEILPGHCRNITGVNIRQDGIERNATIEDLMSIGAFFTTRINIVMRLFNISTLTEQEETDVKK